MSRGLLSPGVDIDEEKSGWALGYAGSVMMDVWELSSLSDVPEDFSTGESVAVPREGS
jgi:hypothetical protein